MKLCARAPFRISFAGGGTDVSPYCDDHEGFVVNATIDKYATVTITDDPNGETANENPLVAGALTIFPQRDVRIQVTSDTESGSGLGSSSAVAVGLVAVLGEVTNYFPAWMTTDSAYHLERIVMGIPGGYQDHYAAACGGFNKMTFRGRSVTVQPIDLPRSTLLDLERCSLLVNTNIPRRSMHIVDQQIARYRAGDARVVAALHETKTVAHDFANALTAGDIPACGCLLNRGWDLKKQFDPGITTGAIDAMIDIALTMGAWGGKLLGAGGSGHLYFLAPPERRAAIIAAVGGNVPFHFTHKGVETWTSAL